MGANQLGRHPGSEPSRLNYHDRRDERRSTERAGPVGPGNPAQKSGEQHDKVEAAPSLSGAPPSPGHGRAPGGKWAGLGRAGRVPNRSVLVIHAHGASPPGEASIDAPGWSPVG
ncbi:hypothetical protein Vau01_125050 [Virgisporangium aurantiacum]|uniref:Uncharacterized protein n=1 Tax=Virgisporangium aurantiacum TaxID=175570 RepID=A0A8J4E850_9ACTN|nr:hypothetical protein Vau01_125050 [Virgisporangium aurantiacum]